MPDEAERILIKKNVVRNDGETSLYIQSGARLGVGKRRKPLHGSGVGTANGFRFGFASGVVCWGWECRIGSFGVCGGFSERDARAAGNAGGTGHSARSGGCGRLFVFSVGMGSGFAATAAFVGRRRIEPPFRRSSGSVENVFPPFACGGIASGIASGRAFLRRSLLPEDARRVAELCGRAGELPVESSSFGQRQGVELVQRSIYFVHFGLVRAYWRFARRGDWRTCVPENSRFCHGVSFRRQGSGGFRGLFPVPNRGKRHVRRQLLVEQRTHPGEPFRLCSRRGDRAVESSSGGRIVEAHRLCLRGLSGSGYDDLPFPG